MIIAIWTTVQAFFTTTWHVTAMFLYDNPIVMALLALLLVVLLIHWWTTPSWDSQDDARRQH